MTLKYFWICGDCDKSEPFREPVLPPEDPRSETNEDPTPCPFCGSDDRYFHSYEAEALELIVPAEMMEADSE